jgi:hypothetical protein
MLTPGLTQLRVSLEVKGEKRTDGEDQLLDELNNLDQSDQIRKAILDEGLSRKSFRLGGPPGSCPCCGQ